jgi:hypothetical protein
MIASLVVANIVCNDFVEGSEHQRKVFSLGHLRSGKVSGHFGLAPRHWKTENSAPRTGTKSCIR